MLYSLDGQRFLCGHDERHWFVAAVEDRVSTVYDSKRSIMPRGDREVHIDREFPRRAAQFYETVRAGLDLSASANTHPIVGRPVVDAAINYSLHWH